MVVYANQCSKDGCCCWTLADYWMLAALLSGCMSWWGGAWWLCTPRLTQFSLALGDTQGNKKGNTNLLNDRLQGRAET